MAEPSGAPSWVAGRHPHAAARDRLLDVRRARQRRDRDPLLEAALATRWADAPRATTTTIAGDAWQAAVDWLRRNGRRAVLFGLIGAGVGWLANTYVMARLYDGFNVPFGGGATGRGNMVWGSLVWTLASVIVSTVVSYRLAVGSERFWREVRTFPEHVRETVRSDGDRALVHLLWGFAGTMVAVLVLAPSFSGLLAVGVLVLLASGLRPLVTGVVLSVWRAVGARLHPDRPPQPAVTSLVVAALGTSVAFAAGFLVAGVAGRVLLGAAAAGAAWFITQQAARPPATPPAGPAVLALVVGLAAAAWATLAASPAWADDGGWAECGASLQQWIGCGGSPEVFLRAMLGGLFSGVGSTLGSMFGGSGGEDPTPTRYADMTDAQKRRHIQDHLLERYPGLTPEQAAEAARQIVDGESTYDGDIQAVLEEIEREAREGAARLRDELALLTSPEFVRAFGEEFWEDISSGRQRDRIGATLEAMIKAPAGMVGDAWKAGGSLWEHRDELMAAGFEWIATASTEDILTAMASAPDKLTRAMVDDYKGKLDELVDASLRGDDAKVADIIGTMAGEAEFEALLGAGMGRAMEEGGDFLKGIRRGADDIDVDVDVPHRRPRGDGDGPGDDIDWDDVDEPRPRERQAWEDEDPYTRPPMTVDDIERRFRELEPGERIRLTPEEAAAWGGYEEQMLVQQREHALQFGQGTEAGNKPWVELKRGNEDALRLRQEGYYDGLEHYDYTLKPNHVKSKSLLAEELEFVPRGMDVEAGEVVSYRPTRMPERGEVSDEVYDRLRARFDEADGLDAGTKATSTNGPVIDRYGRQVAGEAELRPDGRWYTREQVPDASGRRPYDQGYEDTWSGWNRAAGDNDTFAMGAGDELVPGIPSNQVSSSTYGDGRTGWEINENERLTYAASDGSVPGEGNTPMRWTPDSPDFNQRIYDQTLQKASDEGVLLVDADGYFLTHPGTHY